MIQSDHSTILLGRILKLFSMSSSVSSASQPGWAGGVPATTRLKEASCSQRIISGLCRVVLGPALNHPGWQRQHWSYMTELCISSCRLASSKTSHNVELTSGAPCTLSKRRLHKVSVHTYGSHDRILHPSVYYRKYYISDFKKDFANFGMNHRYICKQIGREKIMEKNIK